MATTPQHLVESVRTLASLPDSYQRIAAVVESPNSSSRDIAAAVAMDQSVAGRVLRLANSSFYALSTTVADIPQAVTLIGTRQVRELALAAVLVDVFAGLTPGLIDMGRFWVHSHATGCLARQIANRCREPNGERHFVAGLLASVGRLVLYSRLPREAEQALQLNRQGTVLHEAEQQIFGFEHSAVAFHLMAKWRLPHSLQEAVRFQHGRFSQAAQPLDPAILHLASSVATALDIGNNGETLVPPMDESAWDLVRLPMEALETMATEVREQAEELALIMHSHREGVAP